MPTSPSCWDAGFTVGYGWGMDVLHRGMTWYATWNIYIYIHTYEHMMWRSMKIHEDPWSQIHQIRCAKFLPCEFSHPTAWRGAEPRVIGCWPDVPWKPWPFHWMSWRVMSLRSWHLWNSWNMNDIGDDYVALCGTMWLWCWWLVWHGMTIWLWWLDVIGMIGIVTQMVVVVLRMIVVYNRKEGLQYIAVSFWDQVVGCYWELLSCCGAFSLSSCEIIPLTSTVNCTCQ